MMKARPELVKPLAAEGLKLYEQTTNEKLAFFHFIPYDGPPFKLGVQPMAEQDIEISPLVELFLSNLKLFRVEENLYTRRANVWRAYKTFLGCLGVAPSQSPAMFYFQVQKWLNENIHAKSCETTQDNVPAIELANYRSYDVFLHVAIPELWGDQSYKTPGWADMNTPEILADLSQTLENMQ